MGQKMQGKYVYRWFCGLMNTLIATVLFFSMWYRFVSEHNNTGYLTGAGNLGMVIGIYFVLTAVIMRWMGAYQVGVGRKMNLIASETLAFLTVDFLEVFLSMAIIGNWRYFWALFVRCFLLFLIQSALVGFFMNWEVNVYRKKVPPLHLIEIYGERPEDAECVYKKFNSLPYKYVVDKTVQCPVDPYSLESEIRKYDAVLLSDMEDEKRASLIKLCYTAVVYRGMRRFLVSTTRWHWIS